MGHWGVKSYENDEANDALDAGFAAVHGSAYEDLMDDRNPLTYEEVQARLADSRTLEAAVLALESELQLSTGRPEDWDEVARLAFVGIVVRHAECGVAIPTPWHDLTLRWLEEETLEWEQGQERAQARKRELDLLRRKPSDSVASESASLDSS